VGLRRCSGDLDTADLGKGLCIGISAHELPHIFKRFHRANHIDPSISVFGIGLYLVQERVTHHGGQVLARSTEKSGSTFYVQLPLYIEQPAPQLTHTDGHVLLNPHCAGSSQCICVVEPLVACSCHGSNYTSAVRHELSRIFETHVYCDEGARRAPHHNQTSFFGVEGGGRVYPLNLIGRVLKRGDD